MKKANVIDPRPVNCETLTTEKFSGVRDQMLQNRQCRDNKNNTYHAPWPHGINHKDK